jgi:hypothetical protein
LVANTTFKNRVIAEATCSGGEITEIQVVGPFGLRFSAIYPVNGTTDQWYSDITWTPDASQYGGGNIICTLATDDNNMSSELSCFTIVVGNTLPLVVIKTSTSPTGLLSSSYLLGENGLMMFQFSFSAPVNRPTKSSYIHIYLKNGIEVVKIDASNSSQTIFNDTTVYFSFPVYSFKPGYYYVTFDEGCGVGQRTDPKYCDPGTTPVTDTTFWTFTVPNSSL